MPTAIFDLDGTLADTAPDLIGAANMALGDMGLAGLDPIADKGLAWQGARVMMEAGLSRAGRTTDEAALSSAVEIFIGHYKSRLALESRLYDGVEAALDRLAAQGWRLSVCTNKREDLARAALGEWQLLDRFAAVIGGDTLPVRKPDPDPLWAAIDGAGGRRDLAIMIGDTRTDRDAARAAGLPVILCDFGHAAEPIPSLEPDHILSHFRELPELMSRMRAGMSGR
ncbi:MAG: HAD hydrolase-like protein [Neomegalonema sp.]|nr:HAD hydrolase-like protein [Neomegalonema sp.]